MAISSDSGNCIAALLKQILRSSFGKEQEIQEKVSNTKSDKIISHFRSTSSNEPDTLFKTKRAHMSGNIRSRNRDCLGNTAFQEMVGHGTDYSTLISKRDPNECGQFHFSIYVASRNIRLV